MIYFDLLGTSCFDVYQLFNICIPTLTREVVKQRQKTTVNNLKTAFKNFVGNVVALLNPAPVLAFA